MKNETSAPSLLHPSQTFTSRASSLCLTYQTLLQRQLIITFFYLPNPFPVCTLFPPKTSFWNGNSLPVSVQTSLSTLIYRNVAIRLTYNSIVCIHQYRCRHWRGVGSHELQFYPTTRSGFGTSEVLSHGSSCLINHWWWFLNKV